MPAACYVIAEAGVNHDGNVEDALRLVDAAANAGADCVKFQTFDPAALASVHAEKAEYQKRTTDGAESQQDMLYRLVLPRSAYGALIARARQRKIDFLSTPFDHGSLRFLVDGLGLKRIKVGSGDLTNAPLLLDIARADVDIVLSTGMATLAEIEEALGTLAFGFSRETASPSRAGFAAAWTNSEKRATLRGRVVLLHCTTEYPAPPESVNLRAMDKMHSQFGLDVGYSDHTSGLEVAISAVACGASMIEKHLTLDRSRLGPDHAASLEPHEFKRMVDAIRLVETSLGDGQKVPQPAELPNIPIARKSLVAARAIAAGEEFSAANLTCKRPGSGLSPIHFWDLIGQRARRDFKADELIEQ